MRAPQDEDLFLGGFVFFLAAGLLADALSTVPFFGGPFHAAFRVLPALGRLRSAARCADASAALAQSVRSSGSSNRRAGNCQ
jgi:hypothetical protein